MAGERYKLEVPVEDIVHRLRKKVPETYGGGVAMNDAADALEKAKTLLEYYAWHPSHEGSAMNRRTRDWLGI